MRPSSLGKAILAFFAVAGFASSATATPATVAFARVVYIKADDAFFRLNLSSPMINPDGCIDPDGYIVAYTQAAHQQFLSIALTAQSRRAEVELVIDGCYAGRPKVVSMRIKE
jgi:hypothetical protein